jgi:AcrR family transcriptional regulator
LPRRILLGRFGEQGREAWISAGLEALSADGLDAVRVDVLARKLDISRGSFYHHFTDRGELLSAMLDRWWQQLVTGPLDEIGRTPDPFVRFGLLVRFPYDVSRIDHDVDLAVMLWARRDEQVAKLFAEAERLRFDFISRTLAECDVAPEDAALRALVLLTFGRQAPALDDAGLAKFERWLVGD